MLSFAGLFGLYADGKYLMAVKSKQRVVDTLDMFATEQTFLFTFATSLANREGIVLGEEETGDYIRLDGTPYQGFGNIVFQVNDYAGLVGLNSSNNYHLENLLTSYESSALRRDALLHALYDYTDLDDDPRLSGREAAAYRVARLAPPTNDYLRSPAEIDSVFGWHEWLSENQDFNQDWLSTNWRSRINLNTIPEDLFIRVLNLPARESERLLNRRRAKLFRNMEDIEDVLNFAASLDGDYFTFLPGDEVRLKVYSTNSQRVITTAIRFTPFRLSSAWEVDYRYQSELDYDSRKPAGTVAKDVFTR